MDARLASSSPTKDSTGSKFCHGEARLDQADDAIPVDNVQGGHTRGAVPLRLHRGRDAAHAARRGDAAPAGRPAHDRHDAGLERVALPGPPTPAAAMLGVGIGARGRLRLGDENGTNLVLGASFTRGVGTLLEAAYHWLPAPVVPVQVTVQVTDQPVVEDFGVRLIGDVGVRGLSLVLSVGARVVSGARHRPLRRLGRPRRSTSTGEAMTHAMQSFVVLAACSRTPPPRPIAAARARRPRRADREPGRRADRARGDDRRAVRRDARRCAGARSARPAWHDTPFERSSTGGWFAMLPPAAPPGVEYYIRGTDTAGAEVDHFASAAAPHVVRVDPTVADRLETLDRARLGDLDRRGRARRRRRTTSATATTSPTTSCAASWSTRIACCASLHEVGFGFGSIQRPHAGDVGADDADVPTHGVRYGFGQVRAARRSVGVRRRSRLGLGVEPGRLRAERARRDHVRQAVAIVPAGRRRVLRRSRRRARGCACSGTPRRRC